VSHRRATCLHRARSVDRRLRRFVRLAIAVWLLLLVGAGGRAEYDGVASTLHNLSVSGPGAIRALDETEICKFCHIPHNARAPKALWSRPLPAAAYQTARVTTAGGVRSAAPQPDGSSRLCLSCHDGTVALGEVAGNGDAVAMTGTQRLGSGHAGFLGTDLSGSHPISFVVPDGDYGLGESGSDMSLQPLSAIRAVPEVKLDTNGKMQCTTCHDPHSDRYYAEGRVPRFWVGSSVQEVCLTCHALR